MMDIHPARAAPADTSPKRQRGQSALAFVTSMALALPASGASAADRVVWELRPYRVNVVLVPDNAPQWTERRLDALSASLKDSARAVFGRQWRLDTEVDLAAGGGGDFDASSHVAGRSADVDKVIVLSLRGTASGGVVLAREWDADTGTWGPPIERVAADRGGLAAAAFAAAAAAFSPQARCEKVEGASLTVRLRAAHLPPRDPRAAPLRPGAVLRLAQRGAGGADAELADTYLVVEKNDGRDAVCQVHSRYAEPLSAVSASLSDWLALGVGAPSGSTRMRLTDADGTALAGCLVHSAPLAAGSPLPLGRTDGDGRLTIPSADSPLRVLWVRGGDEVVASLPLVPGWRPEVAVALEVDAARLAAEQATSALRLRLLEEVTRCETLLAEARRKAADGDADGARAALASARERQQAARESLALAAERTRLTADDAAAGEAAERLWESLDEAVAERLASARVDTIESELFPPAPPVETPPAADAAPAGTAPATGTAPAAGTPPAGAPPAGTPPAGTPPAGTPPAGTPPAGTPPAGTPPGAGT